MAKKSSSQFAPAGMADKEKIFSEAKLIFEAPNVKEFLNSLPSVIVIVNEDRKMIFGNKTYFSDIANESYSDKLGLKPGELLGCIHSFDDPGGCGTSRSCNYCGIFNTVVKCQKTGKKIQSEARISSSFDSETSAYDLMVTASPLLIDGKTFTLVTLEDISDKKRVQALERIFFHDLLNKAGSLSCFFETIQFPSLTPKTRKLIEIAASLSSEIVEEINTHRSVMEAEKGELEIVPAEVSLKEVIENTVNQISYHNVAYEKHIKVISEIENLTLITDYFLLVRVLINMLKNALEATSRNGIVSISYKRTKNSICFSVHNDRAMDEVVKHQVFQRSFSTKGSNRGLGTYSMKLLGEHYLGGKISFETGESKGTTFFFELPISQKHMTIPPKSADFK